MKGEIKLHDLKFHVKHGVYDSEKLEAQDFLVNIGIRYDISKPSKSDAISDALDYVKVAQVVDEQMNIPSELLEHLATRIITCLKTEFPLIEEIEVQITKQNPPLNISNKGISLKVNG